MRNKFPESYYKRAIKELLSQDELLSASKNPEFILENTLKMLSELLHLNRGRIYLWSDTAQNLRIRYAYKLSRTEMIKGKYEICEGITGQVFESGKAALISDIKLSPEYVGKVTPRQLHQKKPISYIAVPISHENNPLGVLAVETITHYDGDAEANALVLKLVADMLSKIIHDYELCEYEYKNVVECA